MFPPMLPPPSHAPSALLCSRRLSHVPSYAPPALLSPLRPPRLPFLPSLMLPSPSPLRSCLVLAAVSASPRIRPPPFPGFSCLRFSQNIQPASFLQNSLPVSFLHSIDHAWAIKDAGYQVPPPSHAPSALLSPLRPPMLPPV